MALFQHCSILVVGLLISVVVVSGVASSSSELSQEEDYNIRNDIDILQSKKFVKKSNDNIKKKYQLGDSCHEIQGCNSPELICFVGKCKCGPGYESDSSKNGTNETKKNQKCKSVKCDGDSDCQQFDENRLCVNSRCTGCTEGLKLDSKLNRCITRLGNSCKMNADCIDLNRFKNFDSSDDSNSSNPICRSGRCVCPVNYYPDDRWTVCSRGKCDADASCLMFGVDPYRICSSKSHKCVCSLGYYEDSYTQYCIRHYIIIYSYYHMMFPFMLAIISAIVLILAYIARRYYQQRLSTIGRRRSSGTSINPERPFPRSSIDPKFLADMAAPPPSYDEVVVKQIATVGISSNETVSAEPSTSTQSIETTQIKSLQLPNHTIPTTSLTINPTNTIVNTVANSGNSYR